MHHVQQRIECEVTHMHLQLARLHARNVQHAGEDGVLRGQRRVNALGHVAPGLVVHVAGQQAGVHACGIQRLQQVVHGSVHKPGFVAVGLFGLLARGFQIAGALGYALLQRIGQRTQLACGIFVAGDVGIAGDKAAVG